mmetsp:Transcript_133291/g.231209  ORF Transcript_133291/g.231209 Transcript_133291/m.231209 type:complete len:81 (-) Transcript_133291:2-244(-)
MIHRFANQTSPNPICHLKELTYFDDTDIMYGQLWAQHNTLLCKEAPTPRCPRTQPAPPPPHTNKRPIIFFSPNRLATQGG